MRKIIFVLVVLISNNVFFASEIIVKSELKDVKVFLRGAELKHSASFNFEAGNNTIIISGLANNIDENSLNVKGTGGFTILQSSFAKNYLVEKEKSEKIKVLEDSLELLRDETDLLTADIQVSQSQIDLLLANKNLGTDTKAPSSGDIKNMQEFYKKELTRLNKEIIGYKKSIRLQSETMVKIKKQLDDLNANQNKVSNELIISFVASAKGKGDLEVKYFSYNAGWKAAYDIRAIDIKSPLQLTQKGIIWQNTGLDWNDKKISLSTGNPSLSSNVPEIYPWHLDFYPVYKMNKRLTGVVADEVETMAMAQPMKSEGMVEYVDAEIITSQLTHEFVTPVKYSIASDNKEHMVQLQNYEINAEYLYYAAPKITQEVFLTATIKDWNNNPILPGEANIFFENTYVGKTYLSVNDPKDEVKISLGRDANISVKREEVKDFSEDKFLSSDVLRKFAYKITVKNNKNSPVDFLLEDQIPLSNQEDIEVEVLNVDDAKLDKESGKLDWHFTLEPNKVIEKNLSFSVRYPGDKPVRGL